MRPPSSVRLLPHLPHLCRWEYLRRWGLTTFDNYCCHSAGRARARNRRRRRMCSFVPSNQIEMGQRAN